MQDAVADVLQERRFHDHSFSTGLLFSILLHALLFTPLILSATHLVKDREEPIRVRLAGQQPSEIQRPAVAPAPPAETPVKPAPAPVQPAEPPRDEPRPETRQVEKSLFGESPEKPVDRKTENRERAAPSKQTPQEALPATPAPSSGAPAIEVGGGSAQISGLEGGDFPYTFYVERMLGIIGGNWFRPDVGKGSSATIHFVIERNGTVRGVEITQSSGNATFDRAARRAVIEANPLPPLPFQYTGSELGVHLKFN